MPFCFQRLPTKYFCRAFASWEKHFPGPIFLKNKILTNNLNIISLHWAWPFNKTTVKIHALCSCCNCSYNPSNIQHSSFMSLCHCCNPFMPCTWFSGPLLKIWLPISAGAPLPEAILAPTRTTRPPHQEALHSCWHILYPTQSSPRAKLWLTAQGKPGASPGPALPGEHHRPSNSRIFFPASQLRIRLFSQYQAPLPTEWLGQVWKPYSPARGETSKGRCAQLPGFRDRCRRVGGRTAQHAASK